MTKPRIAAIVAAATLGAAAVTGAAVALAAEGTPSPSASETTSSRGADAHGPRGHGPGGHGPERGGPGRGGAHEGPGGHLLHSEGVVEDAEGGFTTIRMQEGEVTAVSATSISVTSADGYASTYALTDTTMLERDGEDAAPRVGDTVHVRGSVVGTTATADHVHALSPERAAELEDHRAALDEWMAERPGAPEGDRGPGRA